MDAIFTSILNDERDSVKMLLKADAILASVPNDKAKLFESKISHWLYVNDTPLHLAAAGYRVEIVRLLLSAGANPNAAANMRRSTPLHYAADGNVNGPNWNAVRQVKTIERLLAAGADIHASDKNGATPLHRAVRTRCATAVRCLLEAGAEPTLRNKSGSTPFHLAVQTTGRGGSGSDAARAAQRQIIKTFLEKIRGQHNLTDDRGRTVTDHARIDLTTLP